MGIMQVFSDRLSRIHLFVDIVPERRQQETQCRAEDVEREEGPVVVHAEVRQAAHIRG